MRGSSVVVLNETNLLRQERNNRNRHAATNNLNRITVRDTIPITVNIHDRSGVASSQAAIGQWNGKCDHIEFINHRDPLFVTADTP
jgi:hypothetical protein